MTRVGAGMAIFALSYFHEISLGLPHKDVSLALALALVPLVPVFAVGVPGTRCVPRACLRPAAREVEATHAARPSSLPSPFPVMRYA